MLNDEIIFISLKNCALVYLINTTPPLISSPIPTSSNIIVGRLLPLSGGVCAASVDSGSGVTAIVAVGVAVGAIVGAMVPDGVAMPSTWVPLLRISNICVIATALFVLSTVVIVTLWRPAGSGLGGVKVHRPFVATVVVPAIGVVMPMVSDTCLPGIPVP